MYVVTERLTASGLMTGRCGSQYQAIQASLRSNYQNISSARKLACLAASHSHALSSVCTSVSRAGGLHGCQRQQLPHSSVQAPHHKRQSTRRVACRVLTESAHMAIGSKAPDFELPEPLTGKSIRLNEATAGATATLVMFICNHCPFVVMLKPAIAALAKEYQAKGVAVIAISSNSIQTHPQDGPEKMAQDAKTHGYTFPYLYDESQSVAKAYQAACTPEFYVFDKNLHLTYHGQFDDARPNNGKEVTGADLRLALDAVVAGSGLPAGFKARPSIGCNIK
eukprot:GHUV01022997.1.p1 GENE.GHUV01022997.1~~GHUV01022997.1.p1  ORF type:complete len:280 (+),score=32.07 GHUV01022997.1:251-1090(+)